MSPYFLDRFIKDYLIAEKKSSDTTIKEYQRNLRLICEKVDLLKAQSFDDVHQSVLSVGRERQGKDGEAWRHNTTRRLSAVVRVFLRWALRSKIISENPYPFCHMKKERSRESEYFDYVIDQDKLNRIFNQPHLKTIHRKMIITLMMTGIRRNELANLEVKNFDFFRGFVKVTKCKGDKIRSVPMPATYAQEMKPYIEVLISRNERWVFPSEKSGEHISGSGIGKFFDRLSKTTGVHITPRILRHSYATNAVEQGIDPKKLQVALGHEYGSTTLDVYTHVKDENLKRSFDAVKYPAIA